MPSHDLKTKLQRKFGAFLSNDFTSLVLQWQFGDFFPMARGASPGALGATTVEALPKYAYNVHVADAWWHWLKDFDPEVIRRTSSGFALNPTEVVTTIVTSVPTEHISINETIGIVNHYRVPNGDPQAKTYDDHLAQDTDKLTEAIEQRFGQKLPDLLKRFSEAIPQPAQ